LAFFQIPIPFFPSTFSIISPDHAQRTDCGNAHRTQQVKGLFPIMGILLMGRGCRNGFTPSAGTVFLHWLCLSGCNLRHGFVD